MLCQKTKNIYIVYLTTERIHNRVHEKNKKNFDPINKVEVITLGVLICLVSSSPCDLI